MLRLISNMGTIITIDQTSNQLNEQLNHRNEYTENEGSYYRFYDAGLHELVEAAFPVTPRKVVPVKVKQCDGDEWNF